MKRIHILYIVIGLLFSFFLIKNTLDNSEYKKRLRDLETHNTELARERDSLYEVNYKLAIEYIRMEEIKDSIEYRASFLDLEISDKENQIKTKTQELDNIRQELKNREDTILNILNQEKTPENLINSLKNKL